MTFVKRIDKHPAYGSADDPEATVVRCHCGEQVEHYVNQELTPEGKLRDGFTCPNSIFHQVGENRLETEDADLTCCSHKIERSP